MKKYVSAGEAAKLLNVKVYRLSYAHSIGVQEPERFCGKRAYSAADIRILAEHFGLELSTTALNGLEEEKND
jgi:DNA-binding transcriptional MerR regulator